MNQQQRNLDIEIQYKLSEQLIQSNLELQLINRFSQSIQEGRSSREVLFILSKFCVDELSCDDCYIRLYNSDQKRLDKMMVHGSGNQVPIKSQCPDSIPLDMCIEGKAATTMEPQFEKILNENSEKNNFENYIMGCYAIPMIHMKQLVGVVAIKHFNAKEFKKKNFNTLCTLASITATKLLQSTHFEERMEYQKQLEEYIHVISHDMKSPLRSINALIAWIKEDNDGKLDKTTLNNFQLIDETLLQMENLIDGTLNYSKIGYLNKGHETICLNEIIENLKLSLVIPDHIDLNLKNPLPEVRGDKTHFIQIYQNLLSNAIRYIDNDKGKITLDWKETDGYFVFIVKDNGIGIPKAYHEKIFQIFQSLNNKKESSGIGLSIVKKLVKIYQGDVWVKSEEGKGSKFYFSIRR
ncbi:MAG: GHKL domain-containing protein [Maribacter sp.]|nr:GHKL domain-containing protein [Maribacter sp.]